MVRLFHALTVAVVFAALSIQTFVVVVEPSTPDQIDFPLGIRLWNLVSYFTIWSNLVVLITSVWLVNDPACTKPTFRALRLSALSMISVTGLVYVSLLAHLWNPEGAQAIADYGLHYAAPLLTISGWLLFGPHQRDDLLVFRYSLGIPLLWVFYTFLRAPFVQYEKAGELRDFYPYPFLDVGELGGAHVSLTLGALILIYLGVSWSLLKLERERLRLSETGTLKRGSAPK